jgi:hypothetical protein
MEREEKTGGEERGKIQDKPNKIESKWWFLKKGYRGRMMCMDDGTVNVLEIYAKDGKERERKKTANYTVLGRFSIHSLITLVVSALSYKTRSQFVFGHLALQHARASGH